MAAVHPVCGMVGRAQPPAGMSVRLRPSRRGSRPGRILRGWRGYGPSHHTWRQPVVRQTGERMNRSAKLGIGWVTTSLVVLLAGCTAGEDRSQLDTTVKRDSQGAAVSAGEAGLLALEPGDCIASEDLSETAVFEVVPCDDDHRYIFYAPYPLFEVDGITSEAAAGKQAEPICRRLLDVKNPEGVPADAAIRTIVQYREDGPSRGSLLCFVDDR
jgi:hypothetical protein